MTRPGSLDELWAEKDLAHRFGLRIGKGGRSITVTYWIRAGLRCVEKTGRRFFWEQDVIDFFWRATESQNEP